MPELLAHLTRFLAEERGRILLDNALGEGLDVAALLAKGVDARRRALAMNDRGARAPHRDAREGPRRAGRARIEERRIQIREEVAGIKVGARKDLERFVDDVDPAAARTSSTSAKARGAQAVPCPRSSRRRSSSGPRPRRKEIARQLEALAEKTIALVREDAHDDARARRRDARQRREAARRPGRHLPLRRRRGRARARSASADVREPDGRRRSSPSPARLLAHVRARQGRRRVQEAREGAGARGPARGGEEGRARSSTR